MTEKEKKMILLVNLIQLFEEIEEDNNKLTLTESYELWLMKQINTKEI